MKRSVIWCNLFNEKPGRFLSMSFNLILHWQNIPKVFPIRNELRDSDIKLRSITRTQPLCIQFKKRQKWTNGFRHCSELLPVKIHKYEYNHVDNKWALLISSIHKTLDFFVTLLYLRKQNNSFLLMNINVIRFEVYSNAECANILMKRANNLVVHLHSTVYWPWVHSFYWTANIICRAICSFNHFDCLTSAVCSTLIWIIFKNS